MGLSAYRVKEELAPHSMHPCECQDTDAVQRPADHGELKGERPEAMSASGSSANASVSGAAAAAAPEPAATARAAEGAAVAADATAGGSLAAEPGRGAGPAPGAAGGAGAAGLSVRELKEQLRARGVDFSGCLEKAELQATLERVLELEQEEGGSLGPLAPSQPRGPLADGGFAVRRSDGRRCWVEFAEAGDALCVWEDGSDSIVQEGELSPRSKLPGPCAFDGPFEAARAEAFHTGRVLVAAVHGTDTSSKADRQQALALASDEVLSLVSENAIFWRGDTGKLRPQHLEQLAPEGAPSLAMVLPLAVDAMRVLSYTPGTAREAIIDSFVEALEQLEEHRRAKEARELCESALLRQEQDEEFAASLAADLAAREAAAAAAAPAAASPADASAAEAPEGTRSAEQLERAAEEEEAQLAKRRRVLVNEFLMELGPPAGAQAARLVLRLPTGQRVQRTFSAEDQLAKVRRWAECCPWLPEAAGQELRVPASFGLSTALLRRELGPEDDGRTLADLGLVPSAALLLINKDA